MVRNINSLYRMLGINCAFLLLAPASNGAHWTANHVTIDWVHTSAGASFTSPYSGAGWAGSQPAVTSSKSFSYGLQAWAASYSGTNTDSDASYNATIEVRFYIDYVKDDPTDPDAPDTASGLGAISERSNAPYFDPGVFVNLSGSSALGNAQGESDGLASSLSYSWSTNGTMSSVDSGQQVVSQVFSFTKNSDSESGSHVATLILAGPKATVKAITSAGGSDEAWAQAQMQVVGSVTLKQVNGTTIQ